MMNMMIMTRTMQTTSHLLVQRKDSMMVYLRIYCYCDAIFSNGIQRGIDTLFLFVTIVYKYLT